MKKQFTEQQVKSKIKKILKVWKRGKLDGKYFKLAHFIGDYTHNSMNRYIKETLFYNLNDGSPAGATWYLLHPKKSAKKLAKRVMKSHRVTKPF